ncbi:MAG: DUF1801 domain-containing protein [Phycisphaerales bacterium]
MKSKATTVPAYLKTLPPDRRDAIEKVREFVREHLDEGIVECMQYGVIAYVVPHTVWPHGTRTHPELPQMYMGMSSQKNDMVVYMLFLYENERERVWFDKAWKATGKKLHMKVAGMACCLRFKKLEELSLEVIGEAIKRMPVKKYLEDHVGMLERIGRVPGDGVVKKSVGNRRKGDAKTKSATSVTKKKLAKKKIAAKRG